MRTTLSILVVFLLSTSIHAQYGGGTGAPNAPYLISEHNRPARAGPGQKLQAHGVYPIVSGTIRNIGWIGGE